MQSVQGKLSKILIFGYGKEGQSSERFIRTHYPSARVSIYDKNIEKYSKERNLNRYDMVVVSPGVDRTQIPPTTALLTSNVELFFENLSEENRKKIIGITATKGKSTATKFLYELLSSFGFSVGIGGNYGVGVLDLIDSIVDYDFLVLELSSFQLEFLRASPHFAVFLNLYEAHLDRHKTMENYFAAKKNIFTHQNTHAGDLLFTTAMYSEFREPARSFFEALKSSGDPHVVFAEQLDADYFPEHSVLRAKHILQNLGIVAEVARTILKHDPALEEKIKAFCASFSAPPHRLEHFATINTVEYVNDSIATTPRAVKAEIEFFGSRLGVLIVGGKDPGFDFIELVDSILYFQPYCVILESTAGKRLMELLHSKGYSKMKQVGSLEEAVDLSYSIAQAGQVVLLSPGAPSQPYFKNFEERGDKFKQLVSKKAKNEI